MNILDTFIIDASNAVRTMSQAPVSEQATSGYLQTPPLKSRLPLKGSVQRIDWNADRRSA